MIAMTRMTTPIIEGNRASIPPDLESFWCLAVMSDLFFLFTIRLVLFVVGIDDSCLDHSFCLSLLHLRFIFNGATKLVVRIVPLDSGESILLLGPISSVCRLSRFLVFPPSLLIMLLIEELHMNSFPYIYSLFFWWVSRGQLTTLQPVKAEATVQERNPTHCHGSRVTG